MGGGQSSYAEVATDEGIRALPHTHFKPMAGSQYNSLGGSGVTGAYVSASEVAAHEARMTPGRPPLFPEARRIFPEPEYLPLSVVEEEEVTAEQIAADDLAYRQALGRLNASMAGSQIAEPVAQGFSMRPGGDALNLGGSNRYMSIPGSGE